MFDVNGLFLLRDEMFIINPRFFFFFFWSFVEQDFKKLRILEKLRFFASELDEVIGLK